MNNVFRCKCCGSVNVESNPDKKLYLFEYYEGDDDGPFYVVKNAKSKKDATKKFEEHFNEEMEGMSSYDEEDWEVSDNVYIIE